MDPSIQRLLERSREFLRESIEDTPRLSDAAAVACMSQFHFHRQFTRTYGETPHAFSTRVKIDRAKMLLATSDLTVIEFCLAVGYSSVGTFSRRFTELVGRSPSDYRRGVRPTIFAVPEMLPPLWTPSFIPHCFIRGWDRT
jgi:AraC-like DNA-binding protein